MALDIDMGIIAIAFVGVTDGVIDIAVVAVNSA
jgi:hypothetical protein